MSPDSYPVCRAASRPGAGEGPSLPEAGGYLIPELKPGIGGGWLLVRELPGFLQPAALGLLGSSVSLSLRTDYIIVCLETPWGRGWEIRGKPEVAHTGS